MLAAAILPTLILSPIPAHLTNPRYLYLPLLATAAGYAIAFDAILVAFANSRWARAIVWLALALFIFFNSATIGERIENRAGFTRQLRQQFRAIYQTHPTVAPGTYLYFLEMPLQTLDISGLMFLRYGANVTVNGIDQPRDAALQNHSAAFVYYYDEPGRFKEQAVQPNATVEVALPIQFENSIALEKIEIVNTTARRGEAFIAILHWRAAQRPARDYTLFAHLTTAAGASIAGADSQPQRGRAPTTTWRARQRVLDYLIIPIDADVPPGEYQVQIGWYDLQTMQRLARADASGDTILLGSFRVIE
ncbi:MAG: hypothetical protein HZC40_09050 [Chloroflexi bacterium]|nr:hypothetical protein [Chloroflexota bacterium]